MIATLTRVFFNAGEEEGTMADDKGKRGKADRDRINVNEKYELDYWKERLRVSGQALAAAARKVGPMTKDIKAYLKAKGR